MSSRRRRTEIVSRTKAIRKRKAAQEPDDEFEDEFEDDPIVEPTGPSKYGHPFATAEQFILTPSVKAKDKAVTGREEVVERVLTIENCEHFFPPEV